MDFDWNKFREVDLVPVVRDPVSGQPMVECEAAAFYGRRFVVIPREDGKGSIIYEISPDHEYWKKMETQIVHMSREEFISIFGEF